MGFGGLPKDIPDLPEPGWGWDPGDWGWSPGNSLPIWFSTSAPPAPPLLSWTTGGGSITGGTSFDLFGGTVGSPGLLGGGNAGTVLREGEAGPGWSIVDASWSDIRQAQRFWRESSENALRRGDWVSATGADVLRGLLSVSGLPTVQESAEDLGSIDTTMTQKVWAGAKIGLTGASWYLAGTTEVTGQVAGKLRTGRLVGLRNQFGEHFYTDREGFFFAIDKTFHRLHIGPWKSWFTK